MQIASCTYVLYIRPGVDNPLIRQWQTCPATLKKIDPHGKSFKLKLESILRIASLGSFLRVRSPFQHFLSIVLFLILFLSLIWWDVQFVAQKCMKRTVAYLCDQTTFFLTQTEISSFGETLSHIQCQKLSRKEISMFFLFIQAIWNR